MINKNSVQLYSYSHRTQDLDVEISLSILFTNFRKMEC